MANTKLSALDAVTTIADANEHYLNVGGVSKRITHANVNANTETLTNKLYQLTPAPGTDHSISGPQASLTAGESLVFGDFVFVKSDGKMGKADADAASTMPGLYMAIATIANDAAGLFALPGSFIRDDTFTWTVGGTIYASVTAGTLSQTAPVDSGDQVQVVGIATHADRMFFYPSLDLVELV